MARGIEQPVRVYLRGARPVDHQLNLMLARAAADLRGALHTAPPQRWKRRRIIRRHLKRLYRDVAPVIFWGEQQAVEAALRSMEQHGAVGDRDRARSMALIRNGSEENLARLKGLLDKNLASAEQLMDRDVPDLLNPYRKGGISYHIMRVARTEMNRSFHDSQQAIAEQSQVAVVFEWRTSRTHAQPDICDRIAAQGPYPVGFVPNKPHPFCLCYIEPIVR